jgi:putative salt-induced outer membrane protein
MIRTIVRTLVVTLVSAGVVAAQSPAPAPAAPKKPPYEFGADFALAASQGNQEVTTLSFGEHYSYTFPMWKLAQTASVVRGTANGVKNAELYQGGLRADYNLTKKLTAYLLGAALRNTPAGLTSQFEAGAGLAYQFLDTDDDKLQLSLGLGALQRKFVGAADSKNDFVGSASGVYRHLFSKVSYFEQTAGFTPNFTTPDAWLFTTQSSLVAPLSRRIGIKVAYLINYNNAPPLKPSTTERFKKFDGLLTTGVQFTY